MNNVVNELRLLISLDESLYRNNERNRRIYSIFGLVPTLTTCGGGGIEPKIVIRSV
jgi:hypothetical protein